MFIKEMKMGQTNPQPSCSSKIPYAKKNYKAVSKISVRKIRLL